MYSDLYFGTNFLQSNLYRGTEGVVETLKEGGYIILHPSQNK
jgi:hypothetical protein